MKIISLINHRFVKINKVLSHRKKTSFNFFLLKTRFCCRHPPSYRWAPWGRPAASSSCASSTPPTAWESETSQTPTLAQNYTRDLTNLPLRTFKKWWTLKSFYCCPFKRYWINIFTYFNWNKNKRLETKMTHNLYNYVISVAFQHGQ